MVRQRFIVVIFLEIKFFGFSTNQVRSHVLLRILRTLFVLKSELSTYFPNFLDALVIWQLPFRLEPPTNFVSTRLPSFLSYQNFAYVVYRTRIWEVFRGQNLKCRKGFEGSNYLWFQMKKLIPPYQKFSDHQRVELEGGHPGIFFFMC